MLRAHHKALNVEINKRAEEIAESKKVRLSREAQRDSRELQTLREKLEEIKEKTGIDLLGWTWTRDIIEKLNAAQKLEVIARNVRWISGAVETLQGATKDITKAVEEMNEPKKPPVII